MEEDRYRRIGAVAGIAFAICTALGYFVRGMGPVVRVRAYGQIGGPSAAAALIDVMGAVGLLLFVAAFRAALVEAEALQHKQAVAVGSGTLHGVALLAGGAGATVLLMAAVAEAAAAGDDAAKSWMMASSFAQAAAALPLAIYVVSTALPAPLLTAGRMVAAIGVIVALVLPFRALSLVVEPKAILGASGFVSQFVFAGFCLWVTISAVVLLRHLGRR
jgi:hypothetical protein